MRTRCPACSTVFRVTSEQLRLKAGKVRCGHCQAVFNAFDHLIADESPAPEFPENLKPPVLPVEEGYGALVDNSSPLTEPKALPADEGAPLSSERGNGEAKVSIPAEREAMPAAAVAVVKPSEPANAKPIVRPDVLTSTEESTQAAREAGLVAARELIDTRSYNRWAAGTLADGSLGSFGEEARPRVIWPFVLAAVLMILALASQLAYHFRTEVVRHLPSAEEGYKMLGIPVPLSANPDLVAIEASDLQSDAGRGLLVLQATLTNRAAYPQAWPALELTLTDVNDVVVSRRVLKVSEYLPQSPVPNNFPAHSETGIKLWIEATEIGAAGYRLYVFYP